MVLTMSIISWIFFCIHIARTIIILKYSLFVSYLKYMKILNKCYICYNHEFILVQNSIKIRYFMNLYSIYNLVNYENIEVLLTRLKY